MYVYYLHPIISLQLPQFGFRATMVLSNIIGSNIYFRKNSLQFISILLIPCYT